VYILKEEVNRGSTLRLTIEDVRLRKSGLPVII